MTELKPCKCVRKYTIEPHGTDFAIYYARCIHRHGLHIALLNEVDKHFDVDDLEKALNRPAESKIKAEAVIDFANYVDRVCTRREFILQTAKGYAANLLKDRNKLEQGE